MFAGPPPAGRFQLETGLHYNWHRSYDPTVGRYTQPDPLGFVNGPGIFGFVGGAPQSRVDFDGRVFPTDHQHCVALREKLQRLREECRTRNEEYAEDKQGLPERIGPGEKLSETRRGHRKLIRICETRIAYYERRLEQECRDKDPCNNTCEAAGKTIQAGAAGYAAYKCLRLLPSLLPPFWGTLIPNALAP